MSWQDPDSFRQLYSEPHGPPAAALAPLPVILSPYQMIERWGNLGSLHDRRAGLGPQEELLKGLKLLTCPIA